MLEQLLNDGYITFSLKEHFSESYFRLKESFDINKINWDTLICTTDQKNIEANKVEGNIIDKDYIKGENLEKCCSNIIKNNVDFHQMFYYGTYDSPIVTNGVASIIKKIIEKVYGIEYNHYINPIFSMFSKGCKIKPHQDGGGIVGLGRLCAILIYLNDDYVEGDGGELVVGDVVIKPEFGNVAILDYTKHDLEHSVNEVLNENFKRKAILFFAKS